MKRGKVSRDPAAALDLSFLDPPSDMGSAATGVTPEMLEAAKSTLSRVLGMEVYMVDPVHCQDALEAVQVLRPLCNSLSQREALTRIQKGITPTLCVPLPLAEQ